MPAGQMLTTTPDSRTTDAIRLLVIFAVLVAMIALPAWLWNRHERNRPRLSEARVISATITDPVFREGARSVAADERVRLAVAIRLEYPRDGSRWLAPVEDLVLDGQVVDHLETERWPEEDRLLRVFWFTLEAPFLGGRLTLDDASEKLALRPFFAPELGRGLMAEGEPEAHADDGVNLGEQSIAVSAGTYRLYARVEVVEKISSSHPLHVATSLAADALGNPRMLRISRRLDPGLGLDPRAGELFRLPGFEVEGAGLPEMQDLAARLVATSSETFAAAAVTGKTRFDDGDIEQVSAFRWQGDEITMAPHAWKWGSDIRNRDIIRQGNHWMVAVADDGDGVLGPKDVIAHAWRRHAALLPLESALEDEPVDVRLYRRARGLP